jgi:hypothetical protein
MRFYGVVVRGLAVGLLGCNSAATSESAAPGGTSAPRSEGPSSDGGFGARPAPRPQRDAGSRDGVDGGTRGGQGPGALTPDASVGSRTDGGHGADRSPDAGRSGLQTRDAGGSGVPASDGGGRADWGDAPDGTRDAGRIDVDVVLASDLDANAPTTVGIVTFGLDVTDVVSAVIEFGPDTDYGQVAPVSLGDETHRTLLLGNKPSSTVHFNVVVEAAEGRFESGDRTFETGPAPKELVESVTVADQTAVERGFLLLSYWRGNPEVPVLVLDADGDLVWWYRSPIGGVARAVLSHDASHLWLVSGSNAGAPVRRVSLDGLTLEEYPETVASHDITAVAPGLMAYLDYEDPDCDGVTEIDTHGTTRRVFDLDNHLERDGALSCHGNALRYHEASDSYVVSSLREDVFVVPRDGGPVLRLAEIVPEGNLAWGGTQHGVHLLGQSLLVFANDEGADQTGFQSGGPSTVVEYLLSTGEEIWRHPTSLYTANLGDAQRLPGGNTLVTISNAATIEQVTPRGEVAMQVRGTTGFGYSTWRRSLYGPPEPP